jgi:hypothetical protein
MAALLTAPTAVRELHTLEDLAAHFTGDINALSMLTCTLAHIVGCKLSLCMLVSTAKNIVVMRRETD